MKISNFFKKTSSFIYIEEVVMISSKSLLTFNGTAAIEIPLLHLFDEQNAELEEETVYTVTYTEWTAFEKMPHRALERINGVPTLVGVCPKGKKAALAIPFKVLDAESETGKRYKSLHETIFPQFEEKVKNFKGNTIPLAEAFINVIETLKTFDKHCTLKMQIAEDRTIIEVYGFYKLEQKSPHFTGIKAYVMGGRLPE